MSEVKNVLRVENATMQFGGVVAVDNLNLEINQGEIVSLIGPNGAELHGSVFYAQNIFTHCQHLPLLSRTAFCGSAPTAPGRRPGPAGRRAPRS